MSDIKPGVSRVLDLADYFAEEEERLMKKALADIAAEQADPAYRVRMEARAAKMNAELVAMTSVLTARGDLYEDKEFDDED